jgi:hypothetical protein
MSKVKYFYDCEFIEYPGAIDLISIAIVDEKDNYFYAISSEFNESKACEWVLDNVIKKLPNNIKRKTRNNKREKNERNREKNERKL